MGFRSHNDSLPDLTPEISGECHRAGGLVCHPHRDQRIEGHVLDLGLHRRWGVAVGLLIEVGVIGVRAVEERLAGPVGEGLRAPLEGVEDVLDRDAPRPRSAFPHRSEIQADSAAPVRLVVFGATVDRREAKVDGDGVGLDDAAHIPGQKEEVADGVLDGRADGEGLVVPSYRREGQGEGESDAQSADHVAVHLRSGQVEVPGSSRAPRIPEKEKLGGVLIQVRLDESHGGELEPNASDG